MLSKIFLVAASFAVSHAACPFASIHGDMENPHVTEPAPTHRMLSELSSQGVIVTPETTNEG
jgi:hypothetical protein